MANPQTDKTPDQLAYEAYNAGLLEAIASDLDYLAEHVVRLAKDIREADQTDWRTVRTAGSDLEDLRVRVDDLMHHFKTVAR